ncbi:MAG: type II CAAX endopeptidase family protein [Lachnospiraceae bacterium]|nr:type II CAAX endopeptidase family protein [Lachnospiraceae bacterium]
MNRSKGANRLIFIMIAISIISPYVIIFIFGNQEFTLYQNLALSQAIYLIPVLIYIIATRGQILNELQLKPIRISIILMVILFAVLMMPVMSWLNLVSMLFARNYMASALTEAVDTPFAMNLLYVALIPAVSEEFMFRGIFFHSYRPAGILKAALVSGLCFGMLHMNLNQFCYAFVLGVVFAFLVEATGSLISSMLAHFVINSSTVLVLAGESAVSSQVDLSAAATAITRSDIMMMLGFYTVLALVCGTLGYAVLTWLAKHSGRTEHMRKLLGRRDGGHGRCVTFFLIATVLLAFGYMILTELIVS